MRHLPALSCLLACALGCTSASPPARIPIDEEVWDEDQAPPHGRDASLDAMPEQDAAHAPPGEPPEDAGSEPPEPTADAGDGMPDPPSWPQLESDQLGTPVLVADGFLLAEGPLWDRVSKRCCSPTSNARSCCGCRLQARWRWCRP